MVNGALTSLPLQVLITSDPEGKDLEATDWLVRKYAITILPSVASLKILRDRKSIVASAKPMIGFGDPIFDKTAQTNPRQNISSLNRSLTSFYRGMTADTTALANLIPLPEPLTNYAPSRTSLELSLKISSLGRLRPSRMSNMSDWTITVSYILRPMHWLQVKWKNLQR